MTAGGGRGESLRRTEQEIVAEKASALGRAGERLQQALDLVVAVGIRLDAEADPAARRVLLDEYHRAWDRAAAARLALVIQREAVGLRHHRVVEQQFPEPPRHRPVPAGRPARRMIVERTEPGGG